jgi:hypothetical protein
MTDAGYHRKTMAELHRSIDCLMFTLGARGVPRDACPSIFRARVNLKLIAIWRS